MGGDLHPNLKRFCSCAMWCCQHLLKHLHRPAKEWHRCVTPTDPAASGVTSTAPPSKTTRTGQPSPLILPIWTKPFLWTPLKAGRRHALSAVLQWKGARCIFERELSETASTLWAPPLVRCPEKQCGVILQHLNASKTSRPLAWGLEVYLEAPWDFWLHTQGNLRRPPGFSLF